MDWDPVHHVIYDLTLLCFHVFMQFTPTAALSLPILPLSITTNVQTTLIRSAGDAKMESQFAENIWAKCETLMKLCIEAI